jgi:outer membrane protein assembly factor BamB
VAVSVFPLPGSRYSRPETQITFRGISRRALGPVRVIGSRSGVHRGRIESDSDGAGASFLPDKPFALGETVTVRTRLDVVGGRKGRFTFAIGHVAPLMPYAPLTGIAPLAPDRVMHFGSLGNFLPAALTVTEDSASAAEGDIFVAPQTGPLQDGPMILDPHGRLVWFLPYPVSKNVFVNDFRVQDLYGQPVLTWWQGVRNTGFGESRGVGIIFDRHYRQIATVRAGNGLGAGSHEFLITPQGDAYITASSPVRVPVSRHPTIDSVVQEIDIKTGLVLFEWHALDHVPLNASWVSAGSSGASFDPYHLNSIALDRDGNLIVSMRNTSAIYKIDHRSGRVLWTLGGKRSSFKMGPGTRTFYQHDAIPQPDGTITIFDNGGGPPFKHPQTRVIGERLDLAKMTATLVAQYTHSPPLDTYVEGGAQVLSDGNVFVGWGAQPYFSEYSPTGRQIFAARFNGPIASYRAYRFVWNGQPAAPPTLTVVAGARGTARLSVSWNGATGVSSWRVLDGASPRALAPVTTAPDAGFETTILVRGGASYFAVQALGASGQVMASSHTMRSRR